MHYAQIETDAVMHLAIRSTQNINTHTKRLRPVQCCHTQNTDSLTLYALHKLTHIEGYQYTVFLSFIRWNQSKIGQINTLCANRDKRSNVLSHSKYPKLHCTHTANIRDLRNSAAHDTRVHQHTKHGALSTHIQLAGNTPIQAGTNTRTLESPQGDTNRILQIFWTR